MKTFQRLIHATAAALGGAGLRRLVSRHCLPRRHERLSVAGLRAPVEVLIDRWGVPHVYAQSPHDLFFAQGYCHARDRFWQMELNRRTARGELAELFGPHLLRIDRFLRRLGFLRAARRESVTAGEDVRAVGEAYAAGVNAYLRHHRLPIEFTLLRHRPRPWDLLDSLAFARFMGFTLTVNWETELIRARLLGQLGPERLATFEPGEPAPAVPDLAGPALRATLSAARDFQPLVDLAGGASNSWVVSAGRSATGRPLLANDPHFRPRMPVVWYLVHLHGGGYDVIGASLPGTLGVLFGHNACLAWGITASLVDCADLFLERADPVRPRRFAFRDEWYDAEVIREEIFIRGRKEPWVEEVVVTRHGPLLNGTVDISSKATPVTYHSANDDHASPTEALLQLNRAANWSDFRAALARWTFPALNFVCADVDGTIAYKLAGRVPIRAKGDGYVPVPGWDGEHEWTGYVPFDELPESVNPPEGIFATANTRPAAPCKHFLARDWVDDARWRRIMQLLRQRPQVSIADCQAIQTDLVSLPARDIAGRVSELLQSALSRSAGDAPPAAHPLRNRALAFLTGWDGHLAPDSVASAIYHVFRQELLRHRCRDLPAGAFDYLSGRGNDEALASVSAFHYRATGYLQGYLEAPAASPEVAHAFDTALDWLSDRLGPDPARWQWGRLHTITFAHPIGLASPLLDCLLGLSRGPFPIGGDADTIAQSGIDPWHPFSAATFTVSYRQIFEVGNWDRSLFVLPTGQSGHPGSPHYADLINAWRRGEYRPLLFSRAAVEPETTETVRLQPMGR
jgi:penicillin amidase